MSLFHLRMSQATIRNDAQSNSSLNSNLSSYYYAFLCVWLLFMKCCCMSRPQSKKRADLLLSQCLISLRKSEESRWKLLLHMRHSSKHHGKSGAAANDVMPSPIFFLSINPKKQHLCRLPPYSDAVLSKLCLFPNIVIMVPHK